MSLWLVASLHGLAFADRFILSPLAMPIEHQLALNHAGLGVALGPALILPYVPCLYLGVGS